MRKSSSGEVRYSLGREGGKLSFVVKCGEGRQWTCIYRIYNHSLHCIGSELIAWKPRWVKEGRDKSMSGGREGGREGDNFVGSGLALGVYPILSIV